MLFLFSIACTSETTQPTSQNGGGAPLAPPPPPATSTPVDPAPSVVPDWPTGTSCTGGPGELYALSATRLFENDSYPLCAFKGKVLLIVNGASSCGYTPQYEPLQKTLYAKYKPQGFYVLAFPSKSFNQEYDTAAEISANCTSKYGITFPMFAVANVNAPNEQPVYTWLKSQPGATGDIPWNFEKFLVSREGKVVKRINYATSPDAPEVIAAIEAELAK